MTNPSETQAGNEKGSFIWTGRTGQPFFRRSSSRIRSGLGRLAPETGEKWCEQREDRRITPRK